MRVKWRCVRSDGMVRFRLSNESNVILMNTRISELNKNKRLEVIE